MKDKFIFCTGSLNERQLDYTISLDKKTDKGYIQPRDITVKLCNVGRIKFEDNKPKEDNNSKQLKLEKR